MIHNPPPRALTIFAQRVAPWFKTPEHVRFLAEQLEAVESGECRRLAISCPPGHGKSTRLEPNGAVILFATRLHEDDLIGRLKAGSSAKEWRFIDLPAIANSSDLLGRSEGEALWPERWPLELLTERKAEVGSMAFSCQYQGAP